MRWVGVGETSRRGSGGQESRRSGARKEAEERGAADGRAGAGRGAMGGGCGGCSANEEEDASFVPPASRFSGDMGVSCRNRARPFSSGMMTSALKLPLVTVAAARGVLKGELAGAGVIAGT